jgi:hypothetical protein
MVKNMRHILKYIPANQFKANGKPIAKLIPFSEDQKSLFDAMAGSVKIVDNIIKSMGETWEADAG